MTTTTPAAVSNHLEVLRARVAEIRERARKQFAHGASGGQTATMLSDGMRAFVVEQWLEALTIVPPAVAQKLERHSAIVAVGGTGRGELAPYSDIDIMFLHEPSVANEFKPVVNRCQHSLYDAQLELGHSVRTPKAAIAMALEDSTVATSLIEMQPLWGSTELVASLKRTFERKVVRAGRSAFFESSIANREEDVEKHGGAVQQLEPDIKCSRGGLRDLHLLRWIGFAWYSVPDIDSLRLNGGLLGEDARRLITAQEFLMKIRMDLHFAAGKAQDRLTRDEQLRIAAERGIEATPAQIPVERFMQEYFQHTVAISSIVARFIARHRRLTWNKRLLNLLLERRQDGHFFISPTQLDVASRRLDFVCSGLHQVLRLFLTAARNKVAIAPRVLERIRQTSSDFSRVLDAECSELFMAILEPRGSLATTLRAMYETGVLEVVLPEFSRVRCLLQFNAYHSYTVDEHTLRAMSIIESFEQEPGPVGVAYREIKLKPVLHLALLLHDVGKGGIEDHSELGRSIAERIANRLGLPEPQRQLLMFLVLKHLVMADVAFRHDIADPGELARFSHMVGSPEWLTMLYVLTVADISAVGPGIWNDWKSGLLTDLYGRAMLILSGKHPKFFEEERLSKVREHVARHLSLNDGSSEDREKLTQWVDLHLNQFPAHYLLGTPRDRVAADLEIIRRLQPGEIVVEGTHDTETDTVEYRIVLDRLHSEGCFHRITGTLTSQRLEILSAQICTTTDGIVVDVFSVRDTDFTGPVPPHRMEEVGQAIRRVLRKEVKVDEMFLRSRRFRWKSTNAPISDLPNRVTIDNDSSDRCNIVCVFAHDRPGLLYTISRAVYRLELSIELAKIATSLDQVLDAFYVTDRAGKKITDAARLESIQFELNNTLAEFDATGHQRFVN
ncbi:MAG: [protein-PII] uridylyltransferase [Planctomycetes bacterium]|nr:[protein-PII] uridylyltransferase [Planctomycetota bacterium]